MKKMCTVALAFSLMTTPILAANSQPMMVNGMSLSVETYSENGSLLVPLRKVGDLLNLTTYYLKDTNQIIVTTQIYGVEKRIAMTLGSKTAVIDFQEKREMVIAPKILNGSTYVPLRFISEIFGCDVNYSNGVVTIVKNAGISDVNTTNKGYSTPIDSPDLKIPSSNNTNNSSTQLRINYLNDSEALMGYSDIINESSKVLLDAIGSNYRPNSIKQLAGKVQDLSISLSEQNIITTEGKALQKAFINEISNISTELTNVYNGESINDNKLISTSGATIKAMAKFAAALEKVGK